MAIEFRKDTQKWGYRVFRAGRRYKSYVWSTKAEAKAAERAFLVELESKPQIPRNALVAVVSQYLVESAMRGRSQWRLDGLRWNFQKFILPFFGESTLIAAIKPKDIEAFVFAQKKRGVSNKTIWNYKTDIASMFNWALTRDLVASNPVKGANLDSIRNRRSRKPPLNLDDFERAASVLQGYDLAWFDFARYTGLRKDEANRARWEDVDWTHGRIAVRGTKTEERAAWIPLAPVLRDELLDFFKSRPSDEFIFPGRSHQTKGKKIYSRRRLFEKITRLTSFVPFMENNPDMRPLEAWKKLKSENYPGGVRLKPKDLRDYFASEVASQVNDPSVVMKLLRHTNLTTTTKYLRVVEERMHEAVKNLGANPRGQFGANLYHSFPQIADDRVNEESELTIENARERSGGGEWSRTTDAADMSRVL
jgi:integrase